MKAAFTEMYAPSSLFASAIRTLPAIYPALSNWLNEQGEALTSYSSHRIIMTLATTIYSDNEDTEAATAVVRLMITASRSRPSDTNQAAAHSSQTNNEASQTQSGSAVASEITQNVTMRFLREKFTGNIGESWNEHVAEYQQLYLGYNLGNQQKLQYLHDVMGGDFKRFYLNNCLPHVNTFSHAVELINQE